MRIAKLNKLLVILTLIASIIGWMVGEQILEHLFFLHPTIQVGLWIGQFFLWIIIAYYISEYISSGNNVTKFIENLSGVYWSLSWKCLLIIIAAGMLFQFLYMIFFVNSNRCFFDKVIQEPVTVLAIDLDEDAKECGVGQKLLTEAVAFINCQDVSERIGVVVMKDDSIVWIKKPGVANVEERLELAKKIKNLNFSGKANIELLLLEAMRVIELDVNRCIGDRIILFSDGSDAEEVKIDLGKIKRVSQSSNDSTYDDIPISTVGFFTENLGISIAPIIIGDISSSMISSDRDKNSIKAMMKLVSEHDSSIPIGIYLFNDSIEGIKVFNSNSYDINTILNELEEVSYMGGTDIQGAIIATYKDARSQYVQNAQIIIILLSDGEDMVNIDDIKELSLNNNNNPNDDIPIYTIGYYPNTWYKKNNNKVLEQIAVQTNGINFEVTCDKELNDIYINIYRLNKSGVSEKLLRQIALITGGKFNDTNISERYLSPSKNLIKAMSYKSMLFAWPHMLRTRAPKLNSIAISLLHIFLATCLGLSIGILIGYMIDVIDVLKSIVLLQTIKALIASILLEILLQSLYLLKFATLYSQSIEPIARLLYAIIIGILILPRRILINNISDSKYYTKKGASVFKKGKNDNGINRIATHCKKENETINKTKG